MRTCDECGVGFSGQLDHCPLCGSRLEGQPVPAAFPVSRAQKLARAARRTVGLLGAAALALLLGVAWWLHWPLEAVAAAVAVLAVGYLVLRKALIRRQLAAEARRLSKGAIAHARGSRAEDPPA